MKFRYLALVTIAFCLFYNSILANQKLSISADAFGQLENVLSVKLSPNGKRIASLRNLNGQISLITRSLESADKGKVHISTFKQGEFKKIHWLSDERLIFSLHFPSRRYGVKAVDTRLIAMDWNKENMINLVGKQKRGRRWESAKFVSQIQDNIVSLLPNDPDHILLELDNADINYPDVFKINVHTGDKQRVVKTRAKVVEWFADSQGIVRLGYGHNKTKNRIIFRTSEDDSWKTIARYDVLGNDIPFHFVGFSDAPQLLYVSKLNAEGFLVYYNYNTATEQFSDITEIENTEVRKIDIDDEGRIRRYTYFDEGYHEVYKDKLWGSLHKMFNNNFPNQETGIVSYSKDKTKFILKVDSITNPGVMRYYK